jgi:lipoprotein-anchoring transpeptidase ErfK/SrfK
MFASCVQPPPQPSNIKTNSNIANANVAQASPSPTQERENATAFTLPLLDALLTDENFVNEAKTSLPLTDEELQKLKDTARNAVLDLSDESSNDNVRSTKLAAAEAKKRVQEVIGAEKTTRLIALVNKSTTGTASLPESKPNSVPTDTRIVVNAPAYRMDVFDQGKLVQSYKIGIGYPEFPLPSGLRSAKSIIFNPSWTPPDEPWVKGKVAPGKKVEAGSKLNPLGPIKIPIGLPSLIHGGKSPSRLGTFASHGCVGLTTPQIEDLVPKLSALAGHQITTADVKEYAKAKTETKEVNLDKPIPVELRYETIVVENGVLRIYRDVYEKGTNTEENLKKVLETFGVSLDQLSADMRTKILDGLKQMASDAQGEPVDENGPKSDKESAKDANKTGHVTKNIKGAKMVEFRLPELAGKGYPAPVGNQT